ncbi:hypothetical protein BE21_08245 [Sorangium cellulosum]|uniref:Uncharacterized protein n=1 Tax=Sorangium cellulosum TaxID=56 RepID=A0A150U2Z5_SORCE|nr:hypothetical protein BE21_08245 [Sorangium cellulosum]
MSEQLKSADVAYEWKVFPVRVDGAAEKMNLAEEEGYVVFSIQPSRVGEFVVFARRPRVASSEQSKQPDAGTSAGPVQAADAPRRNLVRGTREMINTGGF